MRYFLVMNPKSRGGRGTAQFSRIFRKLQQYGLCYSYAYATTYETIRQISLEANRNGFDVIVAVGGDGTINAVLNGFYDQNGHTISGAAMGVIYTGTSPDFCKSYGIPTDPEKAIDTLRGRNVRKIRIMRISFLSAPSGNRMVRFYACCANIGLGARVARWSNALRKKTGDTTGTFISLLRAIMTYKPRRMDLTLDDETCTLEQVMNISAGRTKYIASGIKVTEGIDDHDENCYYLIARKPNLMQLSSLLARAYSGKTGNSDVLKVKYGTKSHISSTVDIEIEFDGDPAGFLPCSIDLAGDALQLICNDEQDLA